VTTSTQTLQIRFLIKTVYVSSVLRHPLPCIHHVIYFLDDPLAADLADSISGDNHQPNFLPADSAIQFFEWIVSLALVPVPIGEVLVSRAKSFVSNVRTRWR
jgi:hypothetical protein